MPIKLPPYTSENIDIIWSDQPPERPYKSDLLHRHYTALDPGEVRYSRGSIDVILNPNKPHVAEIDAIDVWNDEDQNRTIGTMMLQSALAHLKAEDIREIRSTEVLPLGLKTCRRVMGEHALLFFDNSHPEHPITPITFAGALAIAEAADEAYTAGQPATILGAITYLEHIDTTAWSLPTELEAYKEARNL